MLPKQQKFLDHWQRNMYILESILDLLYSHKGSSIRLLLRGLPSRFPFSSFPVHIFIFRKYQTVSIHKGLPEHKYIIQICTDNVLWTDKKNIKKFYKSYLSPVIVSLLIKWFSLTATQCVMVW